MSARFLVLFSRLRLSSHSFWLLVGLFVLFPHMVWGQSSYSDGATIPTVSVTSATAGVQVVPSIRSGIAVELAVGATGAVWIARLDGNCPTVMTDDAGIRLSRTAGDPDPVGYEFRASDGWHGQLCAILESGVTAVTLRLNRF